MTEVKICGLSTPESVDIAINAGATYLGFVIFNKSPRHVDIDRAKSLCAHVEGRAQSVILLVNPDDPLLDKVLTNIRPDILQLHGHETPDRIAEIKSCYPAPRIWKAIPVATEKDVSDARPYLSSRKADLVLFDAKPIKGSKALPGGNGLSFDWSILSQDNTTSTQLQRPFALAGGLTPKNVATAIKLIAPSIVDVSSGVESAPGIKDPALIESFIHAAKTAKQNL